MRIIDAHAHIFPPKIEAAATMAIQKFYDMPSMRHAGSPEALMASGRKAGVEKYLVFSTATTKDQVKSVNDFIIASCRAHQEFLGVGTIHADFTDFEEELVRISGFGLRGIKIHPDFQRFDVDDARLFPVYAFLERAGMFVITHAGDRRYPYSHPDKIARVALAFPKLRIIAAHFGGWTMWARAREMLALPNVYVDTSSTLGFTKADDVLEGLQAFDETHIFFGTDFPMWDHEEEIGRLLALNLPERTLERIFYENFAAFYGL
ncbi:amidohydrolase family protein [Oscillospiraceae bacterium WX1]